MANTSLNLALLNRAIDELNQQATAVEAATDKQTIFIELTKCLGLLTGVALEATALIGDIQRDLRINSVPNQAQGVDPFEGLLGLKPSDKN